MSDDGIRNTIVTTVLTVGLGVSATLYWFFGGKNNLEKNVKYEKNDNSENVEVNQEENSEEDAYLNEVENVKSRLDILQEKHEEQNLTLNSHEDFIKIIQSNVKNLEQRITQNTNSINANNIHLKLLDMQNKECSFFDNHNPLGYSGSLGTAHLSDTENEIGIYTVSEGEDNE